MSDRAVEKSPVMTPDSLRQFLKVNKSLYDLHTSKNYGLDDTGGIQYAGTVENFGSELLIESNKLKLKKPPIDSIDICDALKFYFDIKFANDVVDFADCYIYQIENKFTKQNMMCGLLKSDRLINGYSYSVTYSDISLVFAYGAHSTSDPNVKRMGFFKTTTTPILRIVDANEQVTEIPLTVDDGSEVDTVYYFPINLTTFDLLGMPYPADTYIDSILQAGTFTIDINSSRHDSIPYIWFNVDRFRVLPDFELTNNYSVDNKTLLSVGMDGNSVIHLYPSADRSPCVPTTAYETEEGTWYLKAYGDFINNNELIVTGKIFRIEYLYATTPYCETPIFTQSITYDDELFKVTMNDSIKWKIYTPKPGEYDYDETKPIYPYIYTTLDTFDVNGPSNIINNDVVLLPAFNVKVNTRDFIDYFEPQMVHSTTGVHVDYTTDYSENGVNKLRGVIHDLGKFDGLPKYYQEWMRETHRSHVELYSIRDNIINNSNPMNRQTAGIIIDSGVPQIDISTIGEDSKICISYISNGVFDTIAESESPLNYLSDLGYRDDNTFTYTGIPMYATDQKFIYHGNGIFSLGVLGFNPETEMGRVYGITNDPITYENNGITENRAPRTLARVCDIPHSFVQLVNVKNYSPTYALDPYYVRQSASWNSEQEILLWNIRNPRCITYNGKRIFNKNDDLDTLIPTQYLIDNYSEYTNFNRYIDMTSPSTSDEFEFSVYSPGEPNTYELGDEINIIIGGINFKGTVSAVDTVGVDTVVTDVTIADKTSQTLVNIGNIASEEMVCKTTAVTGSGKGLTMLLTIDHTVWEDLHIKKNGILDDIYALKFDDLKRIWSYRYNTDSNQWYKYQLLIGEVIRYNYYDINITIPRQLKSVYLYNNFQSVVNNNSLVKDTWNGFENYTLDDVDIDSDLSNLLYNHDETFYVIFPDDEEYGIRNYHRNRSTDESNIKADRKYLPEHHTVNMFYSYTPAAKLTIDEYFTDEEIKQPDVYLYSILNITNYTYADKVYNESFISESKVRTWADVLDGAFIAGNSFRYNVYSRSYENDIIGYKNRLNELMSYSRDQLIEIISENYPGSDPLIVEGSIEQYSITALAQYIIQHEGTTRSNAKIIQHKGDSISNGIQPNGGYVRVQNLYHDEVVIANSTKKAYPSTILKLDDNFNVSDLNSFRMYDDLGNDVSDYCLILIRNKLYMFDQTRWKIIKTKNSEV